MSYNIQELQAEAQQLVLANNFPVIASQTDFAKAGDVLKLVKNRIKAIDEKRKSYTDPLYQQQKLIKADFDKAAEPYVQFSEELANKMKIFWTEEKIRVDRLQLAIDKEAEASAPPEGKLVTIVNDIKTSRGDVSTTTMKQTTKWRVVDIHLVPTEFLTIDEKVMNSYVKDGGACPSGVEYFTEMQLSSR